MRRPTISDIQHMSSASATKLPPVMTSSTAFEDALAALADLALAEAESAGGNPADESLVEMRQLLLARQWEESRSVVLKNVDSLGTQSFARRVHRHFASNLAELAECRPGLLDRLLGLPACSRCALAASSSGAPTIAQQPIGGRLASLTPGNDPEPALRRYVKGVETFVQDGRSFALCGLGDGYLLSWLAANPPALPLEREHCVHLIEPHPEVALFVMMLHDLSGERGPLRQQRFQWWVGPDWKKQMKTCMQSDCFIPYPEQFVRYSIIQSQIEKQIDRVASEFVKWEEAMVADVHAHYAAIDREQWLDVLGPNPSRPPRAMLITTRFSTVLQYSIRDVAQALRENGWETLVVIEPKPYHQITTRTLLKSMMDFRPDLVFQIDHLRYERAKLYPPELPFVCWIQDDLPNLMSEEAAAGIGLRDYVLTCAHNTYVEKWKYPARQCIYVDKLTRVPDRPATWESTGPPDLAFVSNASQDPESLIEPIADDFADSPELRRVVEASCRAMIDVYRRGESLVALRDVRELVLRETDKVGVQWTSMEYCDKLAMRLAGHLNNALYRQQALEWVVSIAERNDLSLHLYGQGWAHHPRFAKYAKGYINYGRDLEELTRRARINLQIVPYSCLHQRLLDGLVAGGFFLVRRNALDVISRDVAVLMRELAARGFNSIREARAELDSREREALDELLERRARWFGGREVDPLKRHVERSAEVREFFGILPPHYDDVAFANKQELEGKIGRFCDDAEARRSHAREMREWVEKYFTYCGGMRRIMQQIGEFVANEFEIA